MNTQAFPRMGVAARPLSRRRPGFSLIEVLFAIAILGLGVAAVLSLFIAGIDSASQSQNRSYAAMQCENLSIRILTESAAPSQSTVANSLEPTPRIYMLRLREQFYNTGSALARDWRQRPLSVFIHGPDRSYSGVEAPTPVPDGSDFSWQCRASNVQVHLSNLSDSERRAWQDMTLDPKTLTPLGPANRAELLPDGLVEVVIAVYRNYQPGKKPLATYTTYVYVDCAPGT